MRRERLLLVLGAAAGAAAACARTVGPAPDRPRPLPEPVTVAPGPRLASAEVTSATRDGWTYRTTAAPAGGDAAEKDARLGDAAGELRLEAADEATSGGFAAASGGGGAAGARRAKPAAPPGATAPAPSSPPGDRADGPESAAKSRVGAPPAVAGGSPDALRAVAGPLRAGSTDDNADFDAFVRFLDAWEQRPGVRGTFHPLDVRLRRTIRVLDASGRPVPGAQVAVVDERADRAVGHGTTYGDGRVPLYPRVTATALDGTRAPAGGWLVDVRAGGETVRVTWDGGDPELEVRLPHRVDAPPVVPLDVAFLIDTTGSMGDEIASIQACLLTVAEKIRGLARETDLRAATVLYRDVGDAYLTATHPFTPDVGALDRALRGVRADGGGDGPESLNQGLAETVGGLDWRPGAAKVVFLIADAPPHMDYAGDVPYGESAQAAVAKGIRVHTVAASGIDELGTLVFRQIAQFTRGKFVFLEYGAGNADAARHGVGGAVKRDNLEEILFGELQREVATFGR